MHINGNFVVSNFVQFHQLKWVKIFAASVTYQIESSSTSDYIQYLTQCSIIAAVPVVHLCQYICMPWAVSFEAIGGTDVGTEV